MNAIVKIYLVWKPGRGEARIPVGIIRKSGGDNFKFSYLKKEKLKEAAAKGFTYYQSFPDLEKEYTENVLSVFGQRIMRSERNDLDDFYEFWCIDRQYVKDPYYMLANTQGMLPTDNFEFLADFNPVKGLIFVSEIAGLSIFKPTHNLLQVGDELRFEYDDIKQDKHAIALFKGDEKLGYVKRIHNLVFSKNKQFRPRIWVHQIQKNGQLNRVFIKICF